MSEKSITDRFATGLFDMLMPVVYPQEIVEVVPDSLQRAQDHLKRGFPLFDFWSHMSYEDGAHTLRRLKRLFSGYNRPIVMPAAKHTFEDLSPLVALARRATGVRMYPIVTQRTIEEGRGVSTVQGLQTYLQNALDALKHGGIVSASLQAGGNLARYGEPTRVLSTLVRVAQRERIPNIGILFTGMVPKHSWETWKGAHGGQKFRPMLVRIGGFYVLDEVMQNLGITRENMREKRAEIDRWGHEELRKTLPNWYFT